MPLRALLSRITRRRSSPASTPADRALSDARADAALQRRRQADERDTHHATGGGFSGGGGS